jgi:tripartite-type tricarboxylate transporter receptor subunit TctC
MPVCPFRFSARRRRMLVGLASMPLVVGRAGAQDAAASGRMALIVPAPVGASTDQFAHLVAGALADIMEIPVHVENVPGNGGVTGTNAIAVAPRDGSVVGLAVSNAIIGGRLLSRSARFNPSEDFAWLAILGTYPNAMLVSGKSRWSTFDQWLADARSTPKPMAFASFGTGSAGHLAGSYLRFEESANLTHVTVETLDEGYAMLAEGKIAVLFDGVPNALSRAPRHGHRIIAVTSAARVPALSEVPSFGELWRQSFVVWIGLIAPKDLAPEPYIRLASAVGVLLAEPRHADAMRAAGLTFMGLSGSSAQAFLEAEFIRNAKLIAKLNDEGQRR